MNLMFWLGQHKEELWKPYFHCGSLRKESYVYSKDKKKKKIEIKT